VITLWQFISEGQLVDVISFNIMKIMKHVFKFSYSYTAFIVGCIVYCKYFWSLTPSHVLDIIIELFDRVAYAIYDIISYV